MVSSIDESSPWRITLRQLGWRLKTGIRLLSVLFRRRSAKLKFPLHSLSPFCKVWVSIYGWWAVTQSADSSPPRRSNYPMVAEKVPSVARLTYVDFCYTNSRAFQEPHRKQDAWLRKRQSLCNLNVIIYKINKSSERFKLTGESCHARCIHLTPVLWRTVYMKT